MTVEDVDGRTRDVSPFALGDLGRHIVEGFGETASWYPSAEALVADLVAALSSDVNVLVKGSRSMRMERIVAALSADDAVSKEA